MRTPDESPEHVIVLRMRGLVPALQSALDGGDAPLAVMGSFGESPASGETTANGRSACTDVVSNAAVRHGVRVGMSRAEAKLRCPAIRFVSGGSRAAGAVTRSLSRQLATFSPAVEARGDDLLVVRLRRAPSPTAAHRVAQWILARMGRTFGRRPRIGIGPNVLVARLASRMADGGGIVFLNGPRYREAVGGWRVRELPGVTDRIAKRLGARGVYTIGQLASADAGALGLGHAGYVMRERARGEDAGRSANRAERAGGALEALLSGTFGDRLRAALRREGSAGTWKAYPLEALRRSA